MSPVQHLLSSATLLLWMALPAIAQAPLERVSTPTRVSGVVFEDRNKNGVYDAGDAPVGGVAVSDQVQEVTTDGDGRFTLDARGYGLVFVSQPDGFASAGPFWREVTGASADVAFPLVEREAGRDFVFLHASDPHVDASSLHRLQRVRAMADSIRPAFVLLTGDLVRDALRVPEEVATGYYDLLMAELARFTVPVYTVPGNHEKFGIERASSLVSPSHPLYGNRMYRSYLGPDYYSFSHGGVRFLGLNTVDYQDQWYNGHVDSLQVGWIARELSRAPSDEHVVAFSHIPFVSGGEARGGFKEGGVAPTVIRVDGRDWFRHTVRNQEEVLGMIGARLEIALAGHIHVRESMEYATQAGPQRLQTAAAVVGPAPGQGNAYGPVSGITLFQVQDGHVDDGTFLPLDPGPGAR